MFSLLSVQAGLSLINKGGKTTYTSNDALSIFIQEMSPLYLELPVNLVAKLQVGPGKVFVCAGPYLSYGLSGKKKTSEIRPGQSDDTKNIKYGSTLKLDPNRDGGADIARLDVGLNFLLGYQLTNGFNLHAGYGLGLKNISRLVTIASNENGILRRVVLKNCVLSIGLGFSF